MTVHVMIASGADAMYQSWSQMCFSCTPRLLQCVMLVEPAMQLVSYAFVGICNKSTKFQDVQRLRLSQFGLLHV